MSGIDLWGKEPIVENQDFSEALRNAGVPTAEDIREGITPRPIIPPDPEELNPEITVEPAEDAEPVADEEVAPGERPRDDKGRFLSKEEVEKNKLLDERFGGDVNKLADSYAELEREFHRRNSDTADLRRRLEEIETAAQQPQQPQWDSRSQSRYDRLLDENPGQAAVEALQRNDWGAYNDALSVWGEVDAFNAARFDNELKLNLREQQIRQEYEARLQPTEQLNYETALGRGYSAVASRHPDINELGDAILEAAQSTPWVVERIQNGSQEDVENVFESLYFMARGKQGDLVRGAQEQAKAEQAAEEDQAKAEAIVASASSSPSREGKSVHDRIRDGILGARPLSIQDELAAAQRGHG